jgi:type IV pilus assembly protein PilE
MKKKTSSAGFTLIELMIVVVVIGILAAIAYPSYQQSVRKSKRADGKAALLKLELAQEKLRANCPFYGQSLGAGDVCGANAGATTVTGSATSPDGHYNIAITGGTAGAVTYTATATANTADQLLDAESGVNCGTLTLTFNGGPTRTPAECW